MAPGPEKRVAEVHRQAPYARPLLPAATPSYQHGTPELDASAHAALRSAAAAAAKAAIGQQQRQAAVGGPPSAKPLVQVPGGPAIVKVSGESDPRKVAGKLAHTCREQVQPAPAVFTTGTKCINQAVKAICIARGGKAMIHPSAATVLLTVALCCRFAVPANSAQQTLDSL